MRVLIIDDDKFIRVVYKSGFVHEGIEVDLAQDGEEGIEKARESSPDIILLDIILPNKDGFEFLEEAKKDDILKKIPVIVFSALNQQPDIDRAMGLGALKYMPKDNYMPNQIIEEVKKILSGK
jgi:CheY-like chemotaxis protein